METRDISVDSSQQPHQRGDSRSGRLPLLPGQILTLSDVEGSVDQQIGSLVRQFLEREFIVGIEPRIGVGQSLRTMRGAEITAHEPVSIQVLQGKRIDVDATETEIRNSGDEKEHGKCRTPREPA